MLCKIKTMVVYTIELSEEEKDGLCKEIIGLAEDESPLLKKLQSTILNP